MPTKKSGRSSPSDKSPQPGKSGKPKQPEPAEIESLDLDSLDLDSLDLGPEDEAKLRSLTSFLSAPAPETAPPQPGFDPRLMEEQLASVNRLLADQDFDTLDDANAFLQNVITTGDLPKAEPETPLEQAQQVVYDALRAQGKQREKLARKAIGISPDCADAYVLLAEASKDIAKARSFYEQGVQAGERALGEEVFREGVGEFWGILETRPYMRARLGLAEVLWEMDERQEAIAHAKELLRLNPDDNQGVRYILANWLLAVGDDDALTSLLAQYPDEGSAQWAYTTALHTFRQSGAGRKADKALNTALGANPFVPLYLLALKPPPDHMPAYYGIGDESEAIVYVFESVEGWVETEGALDWLANTMMQISLPGPSPKSGGPRAPKRPRRK
ncbi:MAG: hypothetical protein ACXWQR_12990 [Ktedonobacterales bacterium]